MVTPPDTVAAVSTGAAESECEPGSEDAVDGLGPVAADWPKVACSQATCSGVKGEDMRASKLVDMPLKRQ